MLVIGSSKDVIDYYSPQSAATCPKYATVLLWILNQFKNAFTRTELKALRRLVISKWLHCIFYMRQPSCYWRLYPRLSAVGSRSCRTARLWWNDSFPASLQQWHYFLRGQELFIFDDMVVWMHASPDWITQEAKAWMIMVMMCKVAVHALIFWSSGTHALQLEDRRF